MSSNIKDIKLTSLDDLFKTEESRADENREKVIDIPLSDLYLFKNHPFHVNGTVSRLVEETAKSQGVDEAMKMRDPMAWVGAMNMIKAQAEEIALSEYVYG